MTVKQDRKRGETSDLNVQIMAPLNFFKLYFYCFQNVLYNTDFLECACEILFGQNNQLTQIEIFVLYKLFC